MAKFVLEALNIILLLFQGVSLSDDICDQRPLGTKTEPLPPDNRFKIELVGIKEKYIPSRNYTVRLFSIDEVATFIAFTISVRGDTRVNERNPRKPILLDAGRIVPLSDSNTVYSANCKNSVIQSDITPKTSVTVSWIAPPKDNQCVTIYALIAVKPDVWYNFDGPLSMRYCEDLRKAEDMLPTENDNCTVCGDARYMMTFEGLWSYNTHPLMFPESKEAHFSDVVGATHVKNFYVYRFNSEASQGLKRLASQGNTTELENEICKQLGNSVRTVIKATSPPKPNMATSGMFRVNRTHHQVSLVTAIIPSPDWFLGVANMELCEFGSNKWATNLTLNLYPLDAGADSGMFFESPNEDTNPPQPISRAVMNKPNNKQTNEDAKPFARLRFDLIRTYNEPNCDAAVPVTKDEEEQPQISEEPQATTQPPIEPIITDPESNEDCPLSQWQEWSPCEGICEDGRLTGYKRRERYHLVDGVAVEKYDPEAKYVPRKEVPKHCKERYDDFEREPCEDDCEDPNTNTFLN